MKISIAIPAYKYNEECLTFLEELLESIYKQDYSNYEVVISDQTKDDSYLHIVKKYKLLMDLKYLKNNRQDNISNISSNTNNAIKNCIGDVIKVMHQDDSFYSDKTLSNIVSLLKENPDKKWGALGFIHNYTKEKKIRRPMIPSMKTTIGCPSTSFFVRDDKNLDLYDENIYLLLDAVFHDDLFKKYGNPLIINDICILIRMHENNSQFKLGHKRIQDLEIIKNRNAN